MSFWSNKFGSNKEYELGKLVDNRVLTVNAFEKPKIHVICDIDKTYLETNFESITRLAKIAFEGAKDKITVHGANEILNSIRWGASENENNLVEPRELHFVSSSPPQLRAVLEEKLMLDGIDWSSDTFKNQAYNIRKRRMDLLRHHVGYKSLAILRIVLAAPSGSSFYMIGDNAETDTYIYFGVKCLLEGLLTKEGYLRYLEFSGVEKASLKSLARVIEKVPESKVSRIFIRNVEGYKFVQAAPLTDVIFQFDDFFQVGLELIREKVIPSEDLWQLVRAFHNRHGFKIAELMGVMRAYKETTTNVVDKKFSKNLESAMSKLRAVSGGRAEIPFELKEHVLQWPENEIPAEESILKLAEGWIGQVLGHHSDN
jgi:hypothetical protein